MGIRNSVIVLTITLLLPTPAAAIEEVQISGFVTVAATKSDSEVDSETGRITEDVGFEEDTRLGLQFTAKVAPDISVAVQLLGEARQENFDAFFDWGYVDFAVTDEVNIRAGKLKFPTFLISDYFEVGYAYPWIRPPQEVYSGNPITTVAGLDLLWWRPLGEQVDLLVQPYFGTSTDAETVVPQEVLIGIDTINQLQRPGEPSLAGKAQFIAFDAKNLVGINLSTKGEGWTFRGGYLQTDVEVDTLLGGQPILVDGDEARFTSIGGTFDVASWVGYAEYFEREIEGEANAAFPNQRGYYLTLGHRFGPLLPHLTYAKLEDNDNPTGLTAGGQPSGTPLEQESITLGLRYELGAGAALKGEIQRISPKEGNRGLFIEPQEDDVTLLSVGIDVVF